MEMSLNVPKVVSWTSSLPRVLKLLTLYHGVVIYKVHTCELLGHLEKKNDRNWGDGSVSKVLAMQI